MARERESSGPSRTEHGGSGLTGPASELTGVSSMATRAVLADLAELAGARIGATVTFRAGGGVAIAGEIRQGLDADVAVLAEKAVATLVDQGHLVDDTVRPLFRSEVVLAARSGNSPAIASLAQLQRTVLAADAVGYSTGPSGDAFLARLDAWGLIERLTGRLVQAPPGVPVGSLLTAGEIDLAVQQRSELTGIPGVDVLGPLPPGTEIVSIFSAAVLTRSTARKAAESLLDALADPTHTDLVAQHGLALL
ncbi:MAG: substrate-binding domain-containing protein [Nostocoides sp.]